MTPQQLRDAVLSALEPKGSRILPFSDLARKVLGAAPSGSDEQALREVVADLERRGTVARVRGEKLSRIEFTGFKAGTLAVRGEGRAFLLSGEPGVPDTPVVGLGSALDGDFVLVRVEQPGAAPKAKGGRAPRFDPRPPGTVAKVLVRRREMVVGKIVRRPEGTFIVPFDRKIDARLAVTDGKDLGAPEGIFVEARITAYPDDRRLALAEVVETIGFEGDAGVDVEVVARKWGIPRNYPQSVIAEAEAAARDVDEGERRQRTDFTHRTIVTIDGETARDFDDAIEAEELSSGGFRIGIHIADVSHYVPVGSALDAEAYERGTSVYFPDRAIAMLPERLSNDLCSLRPDEERRAVSAVLTLDKHGETVKSEFHRSLIKSRARLTYTAVGDFLEGKKEKEKSFLEGEEGGGRGAPAPVRREPTAQHSGRAGGSRSSEAVPSAHSPSKKSHSSSSSLSSPISPEVGRMLRVAQRAAHALQTRRVRRGSLDFDLPDADVILGEEGDVVAILKAVRNEAHRLIEEFMLAANEAVARHLVFVPTPAVYRVHDRPDESRLAALRVVLGPLGYDLPEDEEEITPATFQAILEKAEGKPEERFVDDLVLRSQKKALYAEDCRGHYALAATYYTHFTSPIRRYPDLLVHRALVEWIAARRAPAREEAEGRTRWFKEAAGHCSSRERRAESAEREAVAWKKFVFLSGRVGEEFWAYVSAVVGFGLFVTLEDIYVDGLVPISSLLDDFYRYEDVEHRLVGASSGRVYRLGDRLRVKLVKADPEKRGLDFAPAGQSAGPRRATRVEALERQKRGPARRGPAPRRRR